jgi:HEAT repeat protein
MKLLKAFQGATPAASAGYYPSLAVVGGAPAGAVLRNLFESKDENVRTAAAATCSHAFFDRDTVKALARLTGDSSMQVRRAAIRALSMYANWRYEDAQKELIRLATDTGANTWDRLNAADGLAYAVRYQVKGVRHRILQCFKR